MFTALLLLSAAGFCTALCGVIFSQTVKCGMKENSVLLISSFLATGLSAMIFPDYTGLQDAITSTKVLTGIVYASGAFGAGGILLLFAAMKGGHHGLAWTILQTCIAFPLLVCSFVFHTPFGVIGALSLLLLLSGIIGIGLGKNGASENSNHLWVVQALIAFVLCGTQQTLLTLPSHIVSLKDAYHIRIPVMQAGCLTVYGIAWIVNGRSFCLRALIAGAVLGACTMITFLLVFQGLDAIGRLGMAGIGYPLIIGCSIAFFGIYSILLLREPIKKAQITGFCLMLAGMAGLIVSQLS